MQDTKAAGIDLGTTNSAVAWVDPSGRSAMIRNAEGDLLTPSVVLFDDDEVVVGKEARNATTVHPDQVAEWVKRDMGSPVFNRPIRGEYLPPEVIQACILRKLKADLVGGLGSETAVVITVPAYFDEPRRKATADAGELAGLSVLDIVNEPTAAAMAFGETLGYLSPAGRALEDMTVLVYDLGGGTFDVTLLKLAPGDVRALATDGDVQLGGHDWDLRLVDHVAEAFKKRQGLDPRDNPAAFNRLLNDVVEAKHSLTARSHATIQIDYGGCFDEIRVSQDEFEQITADLLERTAYTTRQLLAAAHIEWSEIARVLLVGGSTRMPMVSRMLQETTGITPDRTVNPDEAVARGAALYASYLLATQAEEGPGPGYQVTNVNAHGLGVEGIEQETLRKINVVLIPRNTPLPAKFTKRFITKSDGQQSIVVQVLEGESSLSGECSAIGRTVVRDLPADLPKGWPVEVTFEYATNGLLSVRTVVPGTHSEVALNLERKGQLSREGINRWKQAVTASAGFDSFEAMIEDILEEDAPASEARPFPPLLEVDDTEPVSPIPFEPVADTGVDPDTVVAEPAPVPTEPYPADKTQPPSRPTRRLPHGLINVLGYVGGAVLGIVIGYLIISWLFPNHNLPRFW